MHVKYAFNCLLISVCLLSVAMVQAQSQPKTAANQTSNSASHDFTGASDRIQSEVLLQAASSWDGVAYQAYADGQPQLTVVKLTIAPHTTLAWHSHPMPNAAYIVSGELLVQKQSDGQERKLGAGEVLAEMVNSVHRGITGDEPVVLVVFYAGVPDMPLSVLP